MTENYYAKGLTAENLRQLLEFWPIFSAEANDVQKMFIEDKDEVLNENTEPFAWCHLYELPFNQHMASVLAVMVQGSEGLINVDQVKSWFQQIADTPGQIGAIPGISDLIDQHFDETDLSDEHAKRLRPNVAGIFGLSMSMLHTLRCVLYHGCFMNELIERIRTGDDKALFDAVRIDPTVIGCISVSFRISKAALLRDNSFFAKLKAAINGKMAKREQANFQKMRLVFEVLHEAGATRLSDSLLHQLFVEELKLYSSNAKGGGNVKALRKFADTYMKKSTTI
jgi:hypothetical protein